VVGDPEVPECPCKTSSSTLWLWGAGEPAQWGGKRGREGARHGETPPGRGVSHSHSMACHPAVTCQQEHGPRGFMAEEGASEQLRWVSVLRQ